MGISKLGNVIEIGRSKLNNLNAISNTRLPAERDYTTNGLAL